MRIDATGKLGQLSMVFLIVFVTILVLAGNYVTAQVEGDPVAIPDLVTAFETLEQTSLALEEAEARSNVKARARARERHQIAERRMQQNLAYVAGVQPSDIAAMSRVGLGWAQICEELGIHPGLLGLKRQQRKTSLQQQQMERARSQAQSRERIEATMRHMKETAPPKHGMAALNSGSKGLGLGMAKGTATGRSSRGFAGQKNVGAGGAVL